MLIWLVIGLYKVQDPYKVPWAWYHYRYVPYISSHFYFTFTFRGLVFCSFDFQKHDVDIIGVGISSSGRFIMTCGCDTTIIVWDLKGWSWVFCKPFVYFYLFSVFSTSDVFSQIMYTESISMSIYINQSLSISII